MKSFLNIPRKVDHGLLILIALAEEYGSGRSRSLEEVANEGGVSQGYLEEVAGLLRMAGLVRGRRGAGGGYVLVKDPADISVADVITAIEGRCWSGECLGGSGAKAGFAARRDVWQKVQGQVMATLHGLTIAGLIVERKKVKNA